MARRNSARRRYLHSKTAHWMSHSRKSAYRRWPRPAARCRKTRAPRMTTSDSKPMPKQWEIWEVEWLHEDGTSKPRPALVVSSNTFNDLGAGVWVAKISSQYFETEHRIELAAGDPSFKSTGLKRSCYLYLSNVRRVDP